MGVSVRQMERLLPVIKKEVIRRKKVHAHHYTRLLLVQKYGIR